MNQMIFFSKEAKQRFDESDPSVKKNVMSLLYQNIRETELKLRDEVIKKSNADE